MSTEGRPTAMELLEAIQKHGTRHDGQTVPADKRAQLAERVAVQSGRDHQLEAAAFCEEIIAWLNAEWNAREFSPEQRIFSIALATVNLRQHFPAERGGKVLFDNVAHEAWKYYDQAQQGA
jgi:hypothetical protein